MTPTIKTKPKRPKTTRRGGMLLPTLVTTLAMAGGMLLLSTYNRRRAWRAEEAALERQDILVDGTELAFVERGTGPVLVLLHGNGSTIEDFETSGLLELAAADHRVIAFDRPGFGASTRPADRLWTAADQADVIDAALAALGIDRYVVLGHSFGASVALECALRHPGRVRGFIGLSGYYFPEPRAAIGLGAMPALPFLGAFLRRTLLPVMARSSWSRLMRKLFRPAPVSDTFSRRLKELATRPSQLRAIGGDSAVLLAERLSVADYPSLIVPAGIMAGDGDDLIDAKTQAGRLAAAIPGSELVIVSGVGHMLHHSAPDAVLSMIASITARLTP